MNEELAETCGRKTVFREVLRKATILANINYIVAASTFPISSPTYCT
jgi:hypothetical protein